LNQENKVTNHPHEITYFMTNFPSLLSACIPHPFYIDIWTFRSTYITNLHPVTNGNYRKCLA